VNTDSAIGTTLNINIDGDQVKWSWWFKFSRLKSIKNLLW
jgi:hypothetical protein